MAYRGVRIAIAAVVAVVLAACTSTLHLAGQPAAEGHIAGADDHHYYVENEAGQLIAVPRRQVDDIDLPGNVLAVTGAVGLGLTLGGNPAQEFDANVTPLLLFGGLATAGLLQWWFAKGALNQPPPPLPTVPFAPLPEVR